ncbi:MAG: mandelate racemase/muconate lactonizing enzyme family protein [Deltaproteobacteria bacterium]|nr:mandelate racemase/muconate lactonizing enzyme family protein [Deltaproteobacteria bacterium]MBW2122929.1 mandelate racemase/muconate lactonizing enzyme family protein [Deltaproteobacteria bacterium]
MKITQIDVYQVTYGYLEGRYAWSGGHSVSSLVSTIVRLSTDEGVKGFGEVCPLGSAYMAAYAQGVPSGIGELAPALIGQDPCQVKAINDIMDSVMVGHNYVKSPVDIACWDILGQVTGLPACTLLGGRYVEDYPLYRPISQQTPEEMAHDVTRFKSEGYGRFQLKVGGDPDEDIRRIRAVLRVLESGDILVADANTGWLMHQAIRVVNGLVGEDLYIEQPCLSLEECLVVRRHTRLPMVIDEVITGVGPLVRAYEQQAMDVINIKLSRVGGLSKAKQIRDLCETLGIVMTLEDSWGGDLTTAAIAHIVGSTRPDFFFTSTDFNSYVDVRLAEDTPTRKDGRLAVPSGSGLGVHVDEKALGKAVLTVK